MTDVTRILNQIEQGDPAASEHLLPLVYEELRILARQRLASVPSAPCSANPVETQIQTEF